jgi:hypothetical protein
VEREEPSENTALNTEVGCGICKWKDRASFALLTHRQDVGTAHGEYREHVN